jgi:hypothetical protein
MIGGEAGNGCSDHREKGQIGQGWRGRMKPLGEGKEGHKAHRGGGGTSTESSPEVAMAVGLVLGCARWGKEERERGPGGWGVWLSARPSEGGGGGSGWRGALTNGGPGQQRRGRDGGGHQSGGTLMQEPREREALASLYSNFLRFRMDLELKFREVCMS